MRIANANMAAAIRSVTVAKGADPADYVLVAFGGAAPQHACAVARELGIRKVLNHPEAGVLSALGIGLADVVRHRSCGIERALDEQLACILHVSNLTNWSKRRRRKFAAKALNRSRRRDRWMCAIRASKAI